MTACNENLIDEIDNLINNEEEENIDNDELEFCVAPINIPRNFIKISKSDNRNLFNFHKGTTTLAFKFKDGIMVAVDSRASMADCFYWENYLGRIIKIYELRNNEKISVRGASTILSNILFQYKGYGLCCGIILSGYDHTGFNMFFIDDEGKKVEGNVFSCGSGSSYAYSILDSNYDYNLNVDQAVELARNAIYHATFRDGGSGGKVRVYYIHKNGYDRMIEGEDVKDLHFHYTNISQ
uniref:Proteasome endopeptidase complex n=1 Tax=Piliocolobus tephrosceles TaxID=591936 RepID=A0A8C9GQ95_9PRIM